jgi:hypothetical protein
VTELSVMSSSGEMSGSLRPVTLGFGASMTAKKSVAALAALEMLIIGAAVWLMPKAICRRLKSVQYSVAILKKVYLGSDYNKPYDFGHGRERRCIREGGSIPSSPTLTQLQLFPRCECGHVRKA